jgi:DNA-binding CsgD family transcriptional regulator
VARARALLRRVRWNEAVTAADEPSLIIDELALRATLRGQVLDLTPAEFNLLRTLAAHPGRVYSRNAVLDQLHTDGRPVTDRAVDSHVRNLRRKLAAATDGVNPVRSVYGLAMRWSGPELRPPGPHSRRAEEVRGCAASGSSTEWISRSSRPRESKRSSAFVQHPPADRHLEALSVIRSCEYAADHSWVERETKDAIGTVVGPEHDQFRQVRRRPPRRQRRHVPARPFSIAH